VGKLLIDRLLAQAADDHDDLGHEMLLIGGINW
jgi:hypothetical protein